MISSAARIVDTLITMSKGHAIDPDGVFAPLSSTLVAGSSKLQIEEPRNCNDGGPPQIRTRLVHRWIRSHCSSRARRCRVSRCANEVVDHGIARETIRAR